MWHVLFSLEPFGAPFKPVNHSVPHRYHALRPQCEKYDAKLIGLGLTEVRPQMQFLAALLFPLPFSNIVDLV